jgi:hypothetical protein
LIYSFFPFSILRIAIPHNKDNNFLLKRDKYSNFS